MGWLSLFLAALGAAGSVFDTSQMMRPPTPEAGATAPEITLYRYAFTLPEAPVSARCAFAAEGHARLHLNGHAAAYGPASTSNVAQPYLWLDITEFLIAGDNVIAVDSRARGGSATGVLMRIEVQYADGSLAAVLSGPEWRCLVPQGYLSRTDGGEQIDLRVLPEGWRVLEFDHTAWPMTTAHPAPDTLVQQVLPPVLPGRAIPTSTTKISNSVLQLDFGAHLHGTAHVRLEGKDGQSATLRVADQKDALANAPALQATMGSGADTFSHFAPRGFRYAQLSGISGSPEVWAETYRYPVKDGAGILATPNTALKAAWKLSANTIPWCAARGLSNTTELDTDFSLDAARTGSRGLWWLAADARPTTQRLWNATLAPYTEPWEKLLAVPGVLDSWLAWPDLLWHHYLNTGDTALAQRLAGSELESLFAYLQSQEDERGILKSEGSDVAPVSTQVRYVEALLRLGQIRKALNQEHAEYAIRARRVLTGLKQSHWDAEKRVYKSRDELDAYMANVLALATRAEPDLDGPAVLEMIRARGLSDGPLKATEIIEATFRGGDAALGWSFLSGDGKTSWREMQRRGATTATGGWESGPAAHLGATGAVHLVLEEIFGITPAMPGGGMLHIAPPRIDNLPEIHLTAAHAGGLLEARYTPKLGYRFRLPQGVTADITAPEGINVTTAATATFSPSPLPEAEWQQLQSLGWSDRVGGGLGVWIDIDRQRFVLIENGIAQWNIACATATAGAGCKVGSNQTPTGWHKVGEKLGDGAPWGQVFRSRKATKEVWSPGMDTVEDLVLTRVLWLEGLEPGINQGKNADGVLVDSKERFIYIHGTNGEDKIGTPSSHGCVRLYNDDVILAFERIPSGTPVLITE